MEILIQILFIIANILILFLLLKKFLYERVNDMMVKRKNQIIADINSAKEKNQEADRVKKEYEAKLEEIKKEKNLILENTTEKAEAKKLEIIKSAEKEASEIISRGKEEIERERQRVINDLKDQTAALAILAASKVVKKELDQAAHKEEINNFIKEVGEVKWQR